MVKVVPTKAVAIPETSSSTRTRSTASRTIREVVEGELEPLLEDVRDGDERSVRRVGAGGDRADVAKDGEVPDRDDVHARVAPRVAVGAELGQQARDVDAGLLGELAPCRLVERLVGALEPAGRRPHALERLLPAPDEEGVQDAVDHGQDDHVDRDREGGERARVVAGRDVRARVLVDMTLTLAPCFGRVNQNRRRARVPWPAGQQLRCDVARSPR